MLAKTVDIQWDIVCFSETRAADGDVVLEGGHRLLSSLGQERHAGVAIFLHARWAANIIKYEAVSGRIMYADCCLQGRMYRVIASYLPHAGYTWDEFRDCLEQLRSIVLDGQHLKYKCIIGGDFNINPSESKALTAALGVQWIIDMEQQ